MKLEVVDDAGTGHGKWKCNGHGGCEGDGNWTGNAEDGEWECEGGTDLERAR